jgi:hypothetical protein
VNPLTLKEAVMHHAQSEEQNKEKENYHKYNPEESKRWWFLLRPGCEVHVLVHESRLHSSPGVEHELKECRAEFWHSFTAEHFQNWRAR